MELSRSDPNTCKQIEANRPIARLANQQLTERLLLLLLEKGGPGNGGVERRLRKHHEEGEGE